MIRLALLVCALSAISACEARSREAVVRDAERSLVLPPKAEDISSYDRYYAFSGGRAVGIFISSPHGKGRLIIVSEKEQLPFVADGGCTVVEVELDLNTRSWARPFCHGM